MAFSAITTHGPSLLRLPATNPSSSSSARNSVSFRFSSTSLSRGRPISIRSVSTSAAPKSEGIAPAISLTENALKHFSKMRSERNEDLCLRIGVKQGGCSGMSYTMDFESKENARPDDSIIEYNGFEIVCDPKSLLFLYGMQLDYSDALIGGGFLSRTLMPHKHVVAVNLLPRRCRIVHMEHLSRINRCTIKKTSKFKCISNLHGSHVLHISEMFLNYL